MHLVWQDAYLPAIYVHILEIRRVKQLDHGLFCTNVCAPTISQALKVFGPNKYYCMSFLYLKYQSRKHLPFPRIENLSKIIHLE